jgi:glycosyltransferase involved in cell wall biosynthesis
VSRAINSVLSQSFRDFELLVIDDNSTDESASEIQRCDDERMRVFRRVESGPGGYAARNFGIERAEAEWIAFLDADDEWLPGHLMRMKELIDRHSDVNIVAEGWLTTLSEAPDGKKHYSRYHDHYSGQPERRLDLLSYLEERLAGRSPFCTDVVTVRRASLREVGGFPAACSRGGDTALWLELMSRNGKVACGTAFGAVYHREASSVTTGHPLHLRMNCVFSVGTKLLDSGRLDAVTQRALRAYLVSVARGVVKTLARSGMLELRDVDGLPHEAGFYRWLFRAYAWLPPPTQIAGARLYRAIKSKLSLVRSSVAD